MRVTSLALDQYRRLAHRHAEPARLAELVAGSGPAPGWVPRDHPDFRYQVAGEFVLVLADDDGETVLVAVLTLGAVRARARKESRADAHARRKRIRRRRRLLKRWGGL